MWLWIRGYVRFKAYNGIVERLLNLCFDNDVCVFDVIEDEGGITGIAYRNDVKKIIEYARQCNVEIDVLENKGIQNVYNKYRKRWGMVIGGTVLLLGLLYSQNFVWRLDVEGNDRVSSSVILNQLKSEGIGMLSYIPDLDVDYIEKRLLLTLSDISWVAINQQGSRIVVSVAERTLAPSIDPRDPCNIIASHTGYIKYMDVYDGVAVVQEKQTVEQGDMLVIGEYLDINDEVTHVHSSALIIADVVQRKVISVELEQVEKVYTGKSKDSTYITLFGANIPLFIQTKGEAYTNTLEQKYLSILGNILPIGILTETREYYTEQTTTLTIDSAKQILIEAMTNYENMQLRYNPIIDKTIVYEQEGSRLYMTIEYVIEMDIAKAVEKL